MEAISARTSEQERPPRANVAVGLREPRAPQRSSAPLKGGPGGGAAPLRARVRCARYVRVRVRVLPFHLGDSERGDLRAVGGAVSSRHRRVGSRRRRVAPRVVELELKLLDAPVEARLFFLHREQRGR